MLRVTGNIWDALSAPNQVVLVTANGGLNSNNELVMGAGTAKQAKIRYPGFPRAVATHLAITQPKLPAGEPYVFHVLLGVPCYQNLGLFQTKARHWEKSTLNMIGKSCLALAAVAKANPHIVYNLPMPGVGCGKLNVADVLPLLEVLPNNVVVWQLSRSKR